MNGFYNEWEEIIENAIYLKTENNSLIFSIENETGKDKWGLHPTQIKSYKKVN